MELLSLSEFVLGGTGSTFSLLSHARGLAVPKYSAFLQPGAPLTLQTEHLSAHTRPSSQIIAPHRHSSPLRQRAPPSALTPPAWGGAG
eukprot:2421115-Rhodomonas_salina.1